MSGAADVCVAGQTQKRDGRRDTATAQKRTFGHPVWCSSRAEDAVRQTFRYVGRSIANSATDRIVGTIHQAIGYAMMSSRMPE